MNPLSLSLDSLPSLIDRLTPRQMEIVSLLAEGKTSRDIANILSIERSTVIYHIHKARIKTGTLNRIQLIVMYAIWKVTSCE